MPKLAVLIIHGMGKQEAGYSVPMQELIKGFIRKSGKNPDDIVWQEVLWEPVLEKRKDDYAAAIQPANQSIWWGIKDFVVTALGDAAGYHGSDPAEKDSTYRKVHQVIADNMKAFGKIECPLVTMAHSLGGDMLSEYIWDVQGKRNNYGQAKGLTPFQRFSTHAGMITFGCNIPLFTFADDPVVPIDFPGKDIPQDYPELINNGQCQWNNYYDKNDVLGYPLKPINAAYDKVITNDIVMNVGGFIIGATPLSHLAYWTDSGFTKAAAKYLNGFL